MIQPLKDYLLVEPLEHEQNPSGLYVPTDTQAKIQKGTVVAVGEWLLGKNMVVTGSAYGRDDRYTKGDTILYSIYGANELRDNGKKYFLVQDKEVWAKETKQEQ